MPHTPRPIGARRAARSCIAALVTCLVLPAASWAAGPNFDAVSWLPLGCDRADLITPASPAAASFAGNHANPPAFYSYDANYLYFRYRMDSNPASGGGFAQYVWTAFMQVPSGDPFQYQYQLLLNGKSDTIEIWRNTNPSDIHFPQFHVDAQVQAYPPTPAGSLARAVAAGTSFNGGPDWFVDFAFPVQALVGSKAITSAGDLAQALFFPATSTENNTYNKSYLNCPFQPGTTLQIVKTVSPTVALLNQPTTVTYTIEVQNTGARTATGVVVEDNSIPSFLANVAIDPTTDDPDAPSDLPKSLPVNLPTLGVGRHLTVQITGQGTQTTKTCAAGDSVNTASVRATNALGPTATFERLASATLGGCVSCNQNADCASDTNACTTETCSNNVCSHNPTPGCVPCTTAADCGDSDACTADTCTNGVCSYAPIPGCVSCNTNTDCPDDNNACTTETCSNGVCSHAFTPGCVVPCTTAADCNDGDPCTTKTCTAGVCGTQAAASCSACTSAADCNDANSCTTDVCSASGSCELTTIAGCTTSGGGGTGTGTGSGGGTGTGSGGTGSTGTGTGGAGGNGGTGTGGAPGGGVGPVPGHVAEICGDCVDNDGDGLVDYEDPDCCERTDPLTLSRMLMRMRPQSTGDTLRLRSSGVTASASLDPRDGVTLQLSDGSGQLYCHDIGVVTTKAGLKHGVFRFRDKTGTLAGGLQTARFKIRKNGQLVFRATGNKMHLRNADGGLTVTLRVGDVCMQTTAALRARPAKLGTRSVFP